MSKVYRPAEWIHNYAERQIRHYVVYRKVSYFTQSKRGNMFLERIISCIHSGVWLKKQ
ncbi:hypothetical protein [Wolbachia endosymbiont of Ctenocephalides felis wCfeT]|uniref:hypothetical protein n=1 Tax=Wolbachia endosymbiont of Ctenocephalides felis wCfeT TaxID=2732593 RepID=UPI001447FF5D|nr:hypothetical protein [Wolbachia endosymbiont of Ctenocephalides felis wCfeT]